MLREYARMSKITSQVADWTSVWDQGITRKSICRWALIFQHLTSASPASAKLSQHWICCCARSAPPSLAPFIAWKTLRCIRYQSSIRDHLRPGDDASKDIAARRNTGGWLEPLGKASHDL